jgi:hypothetical protein
VRSRPILALAEAAGGVNAFARLAVAEAHRRDMEAIQAASADTRQWVRSPEPMRLHTITSMRDHLPSLQEIGTEMRRAARRFAAHRV